LIDYGGKITTKMDFLFGSAEEFRVSKLKRLSHGFMWKFAVPTEIIFIEMELARDGGKNSILPASRGE